MIGWKHGFTSSITDAYARDEADKRALALASSSDKPRPPNVLEHLLHWVISSMGHADAYTFPSVGHESPIIPNETPCVLYDILGKTKESCATYFLSLFRRQ